MDRLHRVWRGEGCAGGSLAAGAAVSESAIVSEIFRAIGCLDGVFVMKNPVGKAQIVEARGTLRHIEWGLCVGSADLIACVGGRFCGLEVKTETGRLRPEQIAWAKAIRAVGGFVAVVRSADEAIEAVKRCRAGANE